jgi:cytochrome c5
MKLSGVVCAMNKPLGTTFCLMLAVTAMSVQSSARPAAVADLQVRVGQTLAQQSSVAQTSLPADASAKAGAVLSKYCITCHNEKRKTAGLTIDTLDLQRVGADAEVWEKIAR